MILNINPEEQKELLNLVTIAYNSIDQILGLGNENRLSPGYLRYLSNTKEEAIKFMALLLPKEENDIRTNDDIKTN